MSNLQQMLANDAFTQWRTSKQFVVGQSLRTRKELKASARELKQRVLAGAAPAKATKPLTARRALLAGLGVWLLSKALPAKAGQVVVVNDVELVFLSDELQPLVLDLTALAPPQQQLLVGLAETSPPAERLAQVFRLWKQGRPGTAE